MRKVTIHQPQYLPWLAYFEKILRSDVFVLLDHVQFQKNGVQNRNQIKTAQGAQWLTVPVKQKLDQSISIAEIADVSFAKKHLRTIEQNYGRAEFFESTMSVVRPVLEAEPSRLSPMCNDLIRAFLKVLGYNGEIHLSSDLAVEGQASDLVLGICKKMNATTYLSGSGGREYMNLESFENENIAVEFQSYQHPTYRQLFPKLGFVPYLSLLDLLMNEGPASRAICLGEGTSQ